MNRSDVDWKGYWPALTTPFTASSALDETAFRRLVRWMLAEGMHGLAVAGSTGEWFSLTPAERKRLFVLAADEVAGRVPVLAGCSAFTPQEVIEYARAAADAGLDGILVTPPPYVHPSDDEVVAFFRAIDAAVRVPITVYNWPIGTGVDLGIDVLARLAALDHVVALKHTTPVLSHFVDTVAALGDRLRIFGVLPSDLGIGLLRHVGGDGLIGAAGILGRDQPGFFEAVWRGDLVEARRLAARDQKVMRDLFVGYRGRYGHSTSTLKAALDLLGLPGGPPRPPLLPLGPDGIAAVRRTLTELGLLQ